MFHRLLIVRLFISVATRVVFGSVAPYLMVRSELDEIGLCVCSVLSRSDVLGST